MTRAAFYAARGDNAAAIAGCTEAIRLTPKDASLYITRSTYYSMKRNLDKAIADCTEAIRINPKDDDAHLILRGLLPAEG